MDHRLKNLNPVIILDPEDSLVSHLAHMAMVFRYKSYYYVLSIRLMILKLIFLNILAWIIVYCACFKHTFWNELLQRNYRILFLRNKLWDDSVLRIFN